MDRNYDVVTFLQNTFILRRPRVAKLFGNIIKISTRFINTIIRDSNKLNS